MSEVVGITEANFLLFASKHYENIFYDTIEFQEDLKRFAYIKRLFNQYKRGGELKERLILNHLVLFLTYGQLGQFLCYLLNYEDMKKF